MLSWYFLLRVIRYGIVNPKGSIAYFIPKTDIYRITLLINKINAT
jgi:hypothetical protein